MKSRKIEFTNGEGIKLVGKVESPVDQKPMAFAVFAHCFACTKNLQAVRNIARSLTAQGIALLRFDFTGLGESEGDFKETSFSSNVSDILYACDYIADEFGMTPHLLIGHSLGGAAVLIAASLISSIKAIVTIGTPSDPFHVTHLFADQLDNLETNGSIQIEMGGQNLNISKEFVSDLRNNDLLEIVRNLKKPYLILHSPQDEIVSIDHAAKLYHHAFHPKSFISLDGSDHLVSKKRDSLYVGNVIASWVKRYLDIISKSPLRSQQEVVVRISAEDYLTSEIVALPHSITADEPEEFGGNDFGMTPYELLSASLGACTAMTLKLYAKRKKWDLQEVIIHLDHQKEYPAEVSEDPKKRIDHFERTVEVKGNLDKSQLDRLLEIADKCPVHRTLHNPVIVKSKILLTSE